jgi:hypothetical protein
VAALLDKLTWVHAGRREAKAALLETSGNGRKAAEKLPLGFAVTGDAFGKALLGGSMSEATLAAWALDPQVNLAGVRSAVLSEALLDLDAPACKLKARACAADCERKLDGAKHKYTEAVSFVEGENIGDPDGNSRVVTVPPCAQVQAGIVEAKVTTYTAIALCARKLAQAVDRLPATASSGTSNGQQPASSWTAAQAAQQAAQRERAMGLRRSLVKEMAEFGLKAAREAEVMALLHDASASKALVGGKEVPAGALAVCAAVLGKHSEAKFLGLMRVKAVYFAALGLADQESPVYDLELALTLLRQARQVHQKYIPNEPAAKTASSSSNGTSSGSTGSGVAALPADLKKHLDAQRKEVDALFRRSVEAKKAEAAKGKKRWSAAFEKNAKDPNAGLPPPKDPPPPPPPELNSMLNGGGVMDPSALLGGALGLGRPPAKPIIEELGAFKSRHPNAAAAKAAAAAVAEDKSDEGEVEEEQAFDVHEALLGAGVLLGAAVAVGFGLRWLKNRRA